MGAANYCLVLFIVEVGGDIIKCFVMVFLIWNSSKTSIREVFDVISLSETFPSSRIESLSSSPSKYWIKTTYGFSPDAKYVIFQYSSIHVAQGLGLCQPKTHTLKCVLIQVGFEAWHVFVWSLIPKCEITITNWNEHNAHNFFIQERILMSIYKYSTSIIKHKPKTLPYVTNLRYYVS